MSAITRIGVAAAAALCAAPAAANPTLGGPMSHLLVSVFNQQVFLSFESPSMSTVTMQDGGGFTGPASVLNGTGYNGQFGWLANGFVALPPGAGVFVRAVDSSPWLSVYAQSGFAPILGTTSSDPLWQWNGTMTHNWYATRVHGEHRVSYEVFVGDASGSPLAGWTPGTIGLNFEFGESRGVHAYEPDDVRPGFTGGGVGPVPAPGSVVLALGGLLFARRRR